MLVFSSHTCSTKARKFRMLDVYVINAANDALYYKKFVDLFPDVKIPGPKKFIFFVGRRERWGYISNWLLEAHGHFSEDRYLFRTLEHKMMYLKAKLFEDTEIMKKIIRAHDPSEAKALGLQVSGFNEKIWRHYRYKFILQAVWHKYSAFRQKGCSNFYSYYFAATNYLNN